MSVLELKYSGKWAQQRVWIATAVALLFHVAGAIGLVWINRPLFLSATALNLFLMFLLLVWTQAQGARSFYLFLVVAFALGMLVEVIGTRTGWLFGEYRYGKVLGPRFMQVPLLIGLNWFVIGFCMGALVDKCEVMIAKFPGQRVQRQRPWLISTLKTIAGVIGFVIFDRVMEKPAMEMGYWEWLNNSGPALLNSVCWMGMGLVLITLYEQSDFRKGNQFAVHLIVIQFLFFLFLHLML